MCRVVVTFIWGTVELLVFRVTLESFSALVSNLPVSLKRISLLKTRCSWDSWVLAQILLPHDAYYKDLHSLVSIYREQFWISLNCGVIYHSYRDVLFLGGQGSRCLIWFPKFPRLFSENFLNIWYVGNFDLLEFKVILGSYCALDSKWPVTRKRPDAERKGVKSGTGLL